MTTPTTFALGSLIEAVAARVPGDRPAVVCDGVVTRWDELIDRARRFAGVLAAAGVGGREHRADDLDSGHDHVGLMLDNGAAFLECTIGASIAGATAVSINTRYSPTEVAALIDALDVRVLVHSERLSGIVAGGVAGAPAPLCLAAPTGYDDALAGARPCAPGEAGDLRSDDRIVICTGGTTGVPKGVLWRSDDFFVAGLRGFEVLAPGMDAGDAVAALVAGPAPRSLAPTPLVHFAAQAVALQALVRGGTVLLLPTDRGFDGDAFVALASRYEATDGLVIGDVTCQPIVRALSASGARLPSLRGLMAGSTLLSAATKEKLLTLLPDVEIRDSMGSSETGMQAVAVANRDGIESAFSLLPGNVVLDADGREIPGEGVGILARLAHRSLGYYRDPAASAEMWRDGALGPYTSTGDTVQRLGDGRFTLLGRGATTINTGGEKVFAQEVETAISQLPGVVTCLVLGVPSPVWGREVQALVVWDGEPLGTDELRTRLSARLARYKLPKRVWAVEAIPALNNGKPDYAAAQRLMTAPA
jgi:acyl-CoA synthetase (AMP-forming)/AMP-acid ligase II